MLLRSGALGKKFGRLNLYGQLQLRALCRQVYLTLYHPSTFIEANFHKTEGLEVQILILSLISQQLTLFSNSLNVSTLFPPRVALTSR